MVLLVDTLSFRVRDCSYEKLIDFLGLGFGLEWQQRGVFNRNYNTSCYYEGIILGFDGQAGWDCYVSMSGKGCRTFEDLQGEGFDWYEFICALASGCRTNDIAITRIDIACDERENILRLDRIERYIINHKYLTRCPDKSIRLIKFGEECLYIGSSQSLTLLRIYNKKLERGYLPDDDSVEPWHRCELQVRDDHAQQIVLEWAECNNLGYIFFGHVRDHIKFLKQPNLHDGTQSRIDIAPWWDKFLCNAVQIAWASVKGSEYNMHRLKRYAIGNAGSSVQTMIEACNMSAEELYELYTNPSIKLRPDQKLFIYKARYSNAD